MKTLRDIWSDYDFDPWGEIIRDVLLIVVSVFLAGAATLNGWGDFDRVFLSGLAFMAMQHVVSYLRGITPRPYEDDWLPFEPYD